MLFFIQFWRIPPSPAMLCSPRDCLDDVAAIQAHPCPSERRQNSSLCRWNQSGMLAPKGQATTIELRVPLALDRSQCRQEFRNQGHVEMAMWGPVFDPSAGSKTGLHTATS